LRHTVTGLSVAAMTHVDRPRESSVATANAYPATNHDRVRRVGSPLEINTIATLFVPKFLRNW
jgi:hypothetical protein